MDFDNPKVYGDTSITDGLVIIIIIMIVIIGGHYHHHRHHYHYHYNDYYERWAVQDPGGCKLRFFKTELEEEVRLGQRCFIDA